MKREAFYRPLTILMPIAAVLCTTGVSAYEWRRLKRLEGEASATRAQIVQIDRELRSYEAQPQTEKFPTVPKTPREQAQFLDALRANADVAGVQLIRWSNTTPAPAPAAPASADKPAAGPATGVSPIISVVEVSGHAANMRQFLYNVVRSRRLLNMAEIHWVRDTWPNTHLTFTLTRYVAPPVPLPMGNTQVVHAEAGSNAAPATPHAVNASVSSTTSPGGSEQSNRISLPNPMDAPGIAHGSYQSRLDAGVSQLKEIDRPDPSASPRPPFGEPSGKPAVTNAKR